MRLFAIHRHGRLLFVGPLIVATSFGGRMGYHYRLLAPISTRFKICLNRCDWCWKRKDRFGLDRCNCFPAPDDPIWDTLDLECDDEPSC